MTFNALSSYLSYFFFSGGWRSFSKATAPLVSNADATVVATHKAHVVTFVCVVSNRNIVQKTFTFCYMYSFLPLCGKQHQNRERILDFCPRQGCFVSISFSMASPEDVIEPEVQSSAAQTVSRRRFSHDLHNLSPDELDGLMSSSGKRNLACCEYTVSIH